MMASNPSVMQCRHDGDVLFISGVLNFDSVLSLDEEVRTWITGQPTTALAINLAETIYANSAAIALALGWLRLAREAGKTLSWQQVPQDMLAMARVGGVEALFSAE